MFNKAQKEQQKAELKKYQEQNTIIKNLVRDFFEEKLVKLDIPVEDLEDLAPTLLKGLIGIYKSQSQEYTKFLNARKEMASTSIKDLKVSTFLPDSPIEQE